MAVMRHNVGDVGTLERVYALLQRDVPMDMIEAAQRLDERRQGDSGRKMAIMYKKEQRRTEAMHCSAVARRGG